MVRFPLCDASREKGYILFSHCGEKTVIVNAGWYMIYLKKKD